MSHAVTVLFMMKSHYSNQGIGRSGTSVMARGSDSMARVGGTEAGHVMPDYPVSEPFPDGFNWPDDYEWPTDVEIRQELLASLTELLGGRDPLSMSLEEAVDVLKGRFPGVEAKVAKAIADDALYADKDPYPDPDTCVAEGRGTFFETHEESQAFEYLYDPEQLRHIGVASKLNPRP